MTTEAERLARLEGVVDTLRERVSDMDNTHTSEFNHLRQDIQHVSSELRTEMRTMFWRLFGVIVTMWVTVILAIIFAP